MSDETLEPFSSDESMLKLSLAGAKAFKKDFMHLTSERPFAHKSGFGMNWFVLVVSPSNYDLRMKFIDVYYREYPYVNDEYLAAQFPTTEFTVLSLMSRSYADGSLLHGTLVSILIDRGISYDLQTYEQSPD